MKKTMEIAGHPIGPGHPPFVIAELSANHNGRLDRALETMRAAKDAGADAVKLQTYTADTMTIELDRLLEVIQNGERPPSVMDRLRAAQLQGTPLVAGIMLVLGCGCLGYIKYRQSKKDKEKAENGVQMSHI